MEGRGVARTKTRGWDVRKGKNRVGVNLMLVEKKKRDEKRREIHQLLLAEQLLPVDQGRHLGFTPNGKCREN